MIEFLPNPSPLSFTGKATLVLINTWGFPIARLIKVQQVAFDNQSVTIRYALKNERANRIHCTRFSSVCALARGWQTVDGALNEESQGEWTAFDLVAFEGMLRQLSEVLFISRGDKTTVIDFSVQPHSFQVDDRVHLKQAMFCAQTVGTIGEVLPGMPPAVVVRWGNGQHSIWNTIAIEPYSDHNIG